jgi:type IX secretion system PorP/SprF family membrane protein
MLFRGLLIVLSMFVFSAIGQSQGLHFTQYNMSPLTLNPALSGKYLGTFRIGGIARDQWRALPNAQAYSTQSIYIDSPLLKGFKRGDWIGLGVVGFRDEVSAGALTSTAFKISGAYHLALDKKSNNQLSLGVQFGSETRNVQTGNFRFTNDITSGKPISMGTDPLNGTATTPEKFSLNNWTAGVLLSSKLNKTTNTQFGFSVANLLRPEASFLTSGSATPPNTPIPAKGKLARRATFHGKFDMKMTKVWSFSPSFLYQTTAKQDEIMVQAIAGYLWDAKRDLTFNMGLSYRNGDAVSPILGAQYKKFTLGMAYDIRTGQTLNKLSGGRGGMEIAAYFIQKIYKQPKVKTKIICPRF